MGGMALTNAERQRRFRERRAAGEPVRTVAGARTPPKDRRPRPKQWTDAVAVLRRLQGGVRGVARRTCPSPWATPGPPSSSRASATSDLDALDVKLPRGFGRD